MVDLEGEKRLIQAAQHGDETAFAQLYDSHFEKIYRYIYFRVESTEVAQDLTSEVFERVVAALPRYVHRGVPFLAWLYRIASNRLVDYFKQAKQTGEQQALELTEVGMDEDLDAGLMNDFYQQAVRAALKSLTADQHNVIILRFMEGYDVEQTASLLGKTSGAVSVIQHRALQALKQALKQRGIAYEWR